jgi:NAD(P)-dependent dehydrogenase (short-subunit alcohol dehydrogenase family)
VKRVAFGPGCALVVGGSGALGGAICEHFAVAGSDVFLTYNRNQARAAEVGESITSRGQRAGMCQLDLADVTAVGRTFSAAKAQFGHIHTVCYAGGPHIEFGAIADIDPQEFSRVMNVEVCGFFNLVHAAIPHLRESRGSVVALATGGLKRYPVRDLLSVAPKAALEMIVRGIAREEGRNGIRANSVGVGWIEAGLGLEVLNHPSIAKQKDKFIKGLPIQRIGTPADVAEVVVFLASNAASYVSGEMICVAGGGQV